MTTWVPDGVPECWAEGVVKLLTMPAPRPYTDPCWQVLREDALIFLQDWAAQAHRLGWSDLDLFGVHRFAPLARYDCMTLVPLLGGCQVAALTEASAVIVTGSGACQTFRCHQAVVPAEICLVWNLGGGDADTLEGAA